MSSNLIKYFEKLSQTDKIGHAFLIGNTNINNIQKDIEDILSKYFFCDEKHININDNPDIYVIDNENNVIPKSKIIEIQEKLSTKSSFSNKKIYIINKCELLHVSAANSMLKLLEEPEENIYAFLITENISKVILTIKSRCQVLYVNHENNLKIENLDEQIIKFINLIENKKRKGIAYINEVFEKNPDKEKLREILNTMEMFYSDALKIKLDIASQIKTWPKELIDKAISENSIDDLVKKSLIFNKNRENIDYNLNISLIFDKIFIELK